MVKENDLLNREHFKKSKEGTWQAYPNSFVNLEEMKNFLRN